MFLRPFWLICWCQYTAFWSGATSCRGCRSLGWHMFNVPQSHGHVVKLASSGFLLHNACHVSPAIRNCDFLICVFGAAHSKEYKKYDKSSDRTWLHTNWFQMMLEAVFLCIGVLDSIFVFVFASDGEHVSAANRNPLNWELALLFLICKLPKMMCSQSMSTSR